MRNPVYPGVRTPTIDFQSVRDGRRSTPLYFQVALDTARSLANGVTSDITDTSGKALQLNIAGNAWWSDPLYDNAGSYIAGVIVAHFQDTALGSGVSTPITILPNSAQRVPFTTITLENFAQVGKKARVVYGVDIDFVPGFNSQNTIGGIVSTREYGLAYGAAYKSTTNMASNVSEQVFAVASNVNGAIVWRASGRSINAAGAAGLALIGHTAAPNSSIVGDVLGVETGLTALGANFASALALERPVFVAAGKGLFWNSAVAETSAYRSVLYTLL